MENYSNEELRKDMKEVVILNRIQTVAVVLGIIGFLFSIATVEDLIKK